MKNHYSSLVNKEVDYVFGILLLEDHSNNYYSKIMLEEILLEVLAENEIGKKGQ